MTPDELREKVAEELWHAESVRVVGTRRNVPWAESGARNQWLPLADAAIALVLEEAARVAEDMLGNYDTMDKLPEALRALIKP